MDYILGTMNQQIKLVETEMYNITLNALIQLFSPRHFTQVINAVTILLLATHMCFYASLTIIIMENHIGGRDPLRAMKPGYLSRVLLSDATETNNINAGLKMR